MQTQDRQSRLDLLLDREEIRECLVRYARGVDRFDRELVRSAYHDDAIDEHVGFVGPVEELLDWSTEYQSSKQRHQHYISNMSIDLDGDVAHSETYYMFVATEADESDPLEMFGGRYIDRFERRNGRWAIAARTVVVEWRTNVPSELSHQAFDFQSSICTLARDKSDVSYERPLILKRAEQG